MVTRLKLKEIDGRAPPGVNNDTGAAASLRRTAARKGEVVPLETFENASPGRVHAGTRVPRATCSDCGKTLKSSSYQATY